MKIATIAAVPNLRLAWRRITTGGNSQYKRYFRRSYEAYEIALDANLRDLHDRLIGGTFLPSQAERVYVPKSSGLHRPLSLLHLEDQVLLQAIANVAARRLHKRRSPLQFKTIFSNILEKETSIFFFRRWQDTYRAFQARIKAQYAKGLRWVGDFDLAAFYDTVSHDLLLKTIWPRSMADADMNTLRDCLAKWSSGAMSSQHGHGIPQGPIASDFLAECFFLPIDLALRGVEGYSRYVDDVRLLGRTENEVRSKIILLERHCREHGLIPQSGKFAIRAVANISEALGMLPSIAEPQRPDDAPPTTLETQRARKWLASSLHGKPLRVKDKTRLRYVLFRASPDAELLRKVLTLLPHHPEHSDAFFTYLGRCGRRKGIQRLCLLMLSESPYAYVRGEAWFLLSSYLGAPRGLDSTLRGKLIAKAVDLCRRARAGRFHETLRACHFLCVAEPLDHRRLSRVLRKQPALLQALVGDVLPDAALSAGRVGAAYLRSSHFEPGLSICGRIHGRRLTLASFNLQATELRSQVANTLAALGVVPSAGGTVDAIAETLKRRYGLSSQKSWHALLGAEYVYTLGVLRQAEAAFHSGISAWLAAQNSFQHAIFVALQNHLNATGHAAACRTVDRNGNQVEFGVMLDRTGPFPRHSAAIGDCFRAMNSRRNRLPVSHPYDKKTGTRSTYLTAQERNRFVHNLRATLPLFAQLMP